MKRPHLGGEAEYMGAVQSLTYQFVTDFDRVFGMLRSYLIC